MTETSWIIRCYQHRHEENDLVRLMLTDCLWEKLRKSIEYTAAYVTDGLRLCIEGILWRFRTGVPWRDLPPFFGSWKTVYNRFNEWSKLGVWRNLFDLISGELDNEWNFMDGTYIKAHQHSAGGIEPLENRTVGKSKGGNTTKVHLLTDAYGNPIDFKLTAGNIHDVTIGLALVEMSDGENIIADKGYDAEYIREAIVAKGSAPHIPRKSNSSKPNPHFDRELYRHRHLVENLFAKLKHFRAFATRFDKLTRNYYSVVSLGCVMLWLKL